MRLARSLALALVALLALSAPASAGPSKGKKAAGSKKKKKAAISKAAPDVQLEVRAVLLDYSKALAAHDWQKASAFYTDDATLWGNRKLRGKEAIVAWLKDFTSLKMVDMTLRDTLVRNLGDGAVTVLGHWDSSVAWEEKGKLQTTSAKDGSFLYVMIKQGGTWKVQTALVARKSGIGSAPASTAATPAGKEPPKAEPPSEQPKPEDDEGDDDEEEDKPKGGAGKGAKAGSEKDEDKSKAKPKK